MTNYQSYLIKNYKKVINDELKHIDVWFDNYIIKLKYDLDNISMSNSNHLKILESKCGKLLKTS